MKKGGENMKESIKTEGVADVGQNEAWTANIKRTYDEFLQESLETVRQNRTLFDKILTDAQQYDNARQAMANQAMQNAIETANMVAKQAVRHGDIAIDHQWNLDEQTWAAAGVAPSVDAIIAALAAAVAKELNKSAS